MVTPASAADRVPSQSTIRLRGRLLGPCAAERTVSLVECVRDGVTIPARSLPPPVPGRHKPAAGEREERPVVESVIRAGDPVVALINVFTVEPENQQRLVDAWQRGTDDLMRPLPGFVSANIHRSLDGTKVVNYAQWESAEAFATSLRDPRVRGYFQELAEIGTPAPVLCELVSVHRAV